MRQIIGDCFKEKSAHVCVVDTREEARNRQAFFDQLPNLYPQMTERALCKNIAGLVGNNLNFIFIIEGTNLIASATLAFIRTATTYKGLVEDVVVSETYRRAHLGKELIGEAIRLGRERGCHYLQLTSRPERAGTSSFYAKAGFTVVARAQEGHPDGTNLYRCHLPSRQRR